MTRIMYKSFFFYTHNDNMCFRALCAHFSYRMYAEKAIIASLLSMTNLVMHVKDLHLEIAAAFQATTFDAFTEDPTHPIRRLLDPFIHRSVQATNDNFKLLLE